MVMSGDIIDDAVEATSFRAKDMNFSRQFNISPFSVEQTTCLLTAPPATTRFT